MRYFIPALIIFVAAACKQNKSAVYDDVVQYQATQRDTATIMHRTESLQAYSPASQTINTATTTPQQLLAYATTLIGTPYKYGSTNPAEGFDCSGFITYVFNHFNIAVPRSSIDFTNVQTQVPLQHAKPGDLVLFTGTDSTIRDVGHMGIITFVSNDSVSFIHSSSGKAHGVTITPLNIYYMGRFVKVIRVFKQNED